MKLQPRSTLSGPSLEPFDIDVAAELVVQYRTTRPG
jgi:hypothetical protein